MNYEINHFFHFFKIRFLGVDLNKFEYILVYQYIHQYYLRVNISKPNLV